MHTTLRFTRLAVLATLLLSFITVDALAQRGKRTEREAPDKATVIAERLDTLTEAVTLSAAQAEQIRPLLEADFDATEALRQEMRAQGRYMSREDREAFREKMDAQRTASAEHIETLLTPEQTEAYRAHREAEAEKQRGQRRGRRGGRGTR